jgi:ActR/RegA family two-component response regulator
MMVANIDSSMALQVLVVDSDRAALAAMAATLEASGFTPTVADDFECATAQLRTGSFPFLVTAERLGAHNGLHLVLRAKANRAAIGAVVTTTKADPVLEAEAGMFGALCVISPWDHPTDLIAALARLSGAHAT